MDEDKRPVIIVGLAGPNPDTEARIFEILKGHPVQVQITGDVKAR
jgi:hypothetical protein